MHGDHVMTVPIAQLKTGDHVLVRPGEPGAGRRRRPRGRLERGRGVPHRRVPPGPEGGRHRGRSPALGERRGRAHRRGDADRRGDDALAGPAARRGGAGGRAGRFQNLADRAAGMAVLHRARRRAATFAAWLAAGVGLDLRRGAGGDRARHGVPPRARPRDPAGRRERDGRLGASTGILVRNREAFERARDLHVVAFDKTGTLTEGGHRRPRRRRRRDSRGRGAPARGGARGAVGAPARRVRRRRGRTRAASTCHAASRRSRSLAGKGVAGTVDGTRDRIGRPEWAAELGIAFPDVAPPGARREAEGRGESDGRADGRRAGARAGRRSPTSPPERPGGRRRAEGGRRHARHDHGRLGGRRADGGGRPRHRPVPRPGAPRRQGADRRGPASGGARGVRRRRGERRPGARSRPTSASPIGAGTNVAIESADIVLVETTPWTSPALVLSRATYRQDAAEPVLGDRLQRRRLPLAAGVASGPAVLSPALGAVFMSVSTIVVALNAQLLRTLRLRR